MPPVHRVIAAGTIFGEWTVIREDTPIPSKNGSDYRYLVQCSCGTQRAVSSHSLKLGRSRSCGCKREEARLAAITKHGQHESKTYSIWEAMLDRCRNPSSKAYSEYGGRGIKVCDAWYQFDAFHRDMGDKPDSMSLDRIDNNGNYEPSNCRWADAKTQARNRRDNRLVILNGETMCAQDAADLLGVDPPSLYRRIREKAETMQQAVDYYATKRR